MPDDGLFGHMSTYSMDIRVIVLITHIVQGHYPCCSYWLLFGLGIGTRRVEVYSVMSQAIERLFLVREQLEGIPGCVQPEKITPFISEHSYLSLIIVMHIPTFVMHIHDVVTEACDAYH